MLVILFAAMFTNESSDLRLGPFPVGFSNPSLLKLAEDGGFQIGHFRYFRYFNARGEQVFAIDFENYEVLLGLEDRGAFVLLALIDLRGMTSSVRVFDRKGNFLGTCPTGVMNLYKSGDQLFIWDFLNGLGAFGGPFPNQFKPFTVTLENDVAQCTMASEQFGKVSPMQVAMRYDYRSAWVVAEGDRFLSMNELEHRIYVHTEANRLEEGQTGENVPPTTPSKDLTLTGAIPITGFPNYERMMYKPADAERVNWNWLQHHSRILGFYPFRNGYLVAYNYPTCERQPNPGVDCEAGKLALQKLDADLKNVGQPYFSQGIPLGIYRDGSVVVIQPEGFKGFSTLDPAGSLYAKVIFEVLP